MSRPRMETRQRCSELLGCSVKTVDRQVKANYPDVLVERRTERRARQRRTVTYIDVEKLAEVMGVALYAEDSGVHSGQTCVDTGSQVSTQGISPDGDGVSPRDMNLSGHNLSTQVIERISEANFQPQRTTRDEAIEAILALPANSRIRRQAVVDLAQREGVSDRAVYKWLRHRGGQSPQLALQQNSLAKIPDSYIGVEQVEFILAVAISNTVTTSAAQIHRIISRGYPEMLTYYRGSREMQISERTVQRLLRGWRQHKTLRHLFMKRSDRKEFLRTYSGRVVAPYANAMWQIDMTRCDVFVVFGDADAGYKIDRPNVQAIIDVYSGVIMGLSFSDSEAQVQADLAMYRALLPKHTELQHLYPAYGQPEMLYVDNGKIYTSESFERYMDVLGVTVRHSLPLVSHTRGKIERWFKYLHDLERTMVGYVGRDAEDRDDEEIKRLRANTVRWMDGEDIPLHQRFPTITEYQNQVLAWLIAEYHAGKHISPTNVRDGKTRMEHFLQTAPPETMRVLNRDELAHQMGKRHRRVVRGGVVRFDNQILTLPDGALAAYDRLTVALITDAFSLGQDIKIVYESDMGDVPLGYAILAPQNALSAEAIAFRKCAREVKRAEVAAAEQHRNMLLDPRLRYGNILAQSVQLPQQRVANQDAVALPVPDNDEPVRGGDERVDVLDNLIRQAIDGAL